MGSEEPDNESLLKIGHKINNFVCQQSIPFLPFILQVWEQFPQ